MRYKITCTGETPLILHADSIEFADQMEVWKNDPGNKSKSRAGDDRTPAFRWIGCLPLDGNQVVIPQEYLSRAIMAAAARVPVPGGKSGKTFKQDSMAGMAFEEPFIPLLVRGKVLPQESIEALLKVEDFEKHRSAAAAMGFELFIKRARIGTAKHIRVRPKFPVWGCTAVIDVWDERLEKALPQIAQIAGAQMGLGDWRPGCRTPGPYGRFTTGVSRA